jgi:peroxiredoxin
MMKNEPCTPMRIAGLFVLCILFSTNILHAQEIRPVSVGQPMPDFALQSLQGSEWQLSEMKGHRVMLIFPRGLAGEDHWCHICNYQYAELVELETKKKVLESYDLKVAFILPYTRDMVKEWLAAFPAQLNDIENWKNPPSLDDLDERGKRRMAFAQRAFPKRFVYEEGKVPKTFPILIDADRTLSEGLGLFQTEWGGSQIEQNIPAIILIDREGIVQFKYLSQNTFDRPGFDYLFRFIESMMVEE